MNTNVNGQNATTAFKLPPQHPKIQSPTRIPPSNLRSNNQNQMEQTSIQTTLPRNFNQQATNVEIRRNLTGSPQQQNNIFSTNKIVTTLIHDNVLLKSRVLMPPHDL